MSVLDVKAAPGSGQRTRRRRWIVLPVALLCVLGTCFGYLFATAEVKPSAQLGLSVEVPGGLASITGVIPLENDGWQPPAPAAALKPDPVEGAHRVRVQVQFTALDKAGLPVDPGSFFIDGLGSGKPHPLWSSSPPMTLDQGESANTTMVFELPDKAVALVLEDSSGDRLSLGTEHHTGG
ncbi:hypothetical protein [Arthrobacter crystallopoietes]|uniref:DUF4352 domain-containing protein n=1 Tax=Crystallibacter crystallopoietes TaxID=37928 RepID=A0A1H1CQD3_9MICC|nr:hypothetical protein [Arthrobacter crystallopoietes]AUI50644.1 hypothetical protein AC20117_07195 [Arthrobacter crystallopoietes]SDQ66471.1 hypothetical protein SAMN04489742_2040 [Arthrobacter crystallopoietes]